MRPSLWRSLITVYGAAGLVACSTSGDLAGPQDHLVSVTPPDSGSGPGLLIEVNTRSGRLVTHRRPVYTSSRTSAGPSFSLLDDGAIDIQVSNYSTSEVGAYTPGMVRVRFDVQVMNRLTSVALVPPELTAGTPSGMLMLIPFLQQADTGTAAVYTGNDASVIVNRTRTVLVRPSEDWGGGGALGTSGYDFVRGALCAPPAADCSRWEGYAPLGPGMGSTAQTVGFDVAPTVGSFQVRLLLSANLQAATGGGTAPPPPPPIVIGDFAGIPYGLFHLPAENLGMSYSGLLRTMTFGRIEAVLDSAQRRGGRVILGVARSNVRNADQTFNLTYWKWEVDRYRGIDLESYAENGTVVGMYIIDEPNCAACWGGETISQATVDEMAGYVKTIWPKMATIVRVVPAWFDWYGPPRYLDAAWAQYEGPLHLPSASQTPEEFRDTQVAAAARLGLRLVFGSNVLDGGDGSSGLPGATSHEARFQMSAAEYERASATFAAEPYACAVIDWRYSVDYPEEDASGSRLTLIRAFHSRPDVVNAAARVAAAARGRPTTPCLRN